MVLSLPQPALRRLLLQPCQALCGRSSRIRCDTLPQKRRAWGREESFSEAPCLLWVCALRTLGPERASFLQLLRQQAVPRAQGRKRVAGMGTAQGFHSSRAQESWAGPVWASGFPKKYNFRSWKEDIFQFLKMYCSPQLFYYQDHCQGNLRILVPLVSSPRGGWHQGFPELRTVLTPRPRSVPPRLPFFLTLSPPLCPPVPTQTVCTGSLPL